MFAPATVLIRKIENDMSGCAATSLADDEAGQQRNGRGEDADRPSRSPAPVVRLRDAEHRGREATGDEHRTEGVEATRREVAALAEEHGRECQRGDPDRDVEEEDPLPAQEVGEDAAEQHAGCGSEAADRAPDAERDVALLAFGEGRHEDRQRRRGDDRRAEALDGPGADQRGLVPRERREERRRREHDEAADEHATAAEDVGGTSAQEQEASEDERIGADHPLKVLLREAQVDLDRREGDVHDRDVEDEHELDDAQERQRHPLVFSGSNHACVTFPFDWMTRR